MLSLLLEKSALCDIIITIGGQNYVIFNQNRRTSRRDRRKSRCKGHGSAASHIPLIGDTIGDVQDLISMLHDYYHGEYKKVPAVVMAGTAAIIAYLVSPLDLIPDNIPLLGFVDDALIINLVMQLCIDKELDRYRAWREQQA